MEKKVMNYYVDVVILILFMALAWSGMLLQMVYHMALRNLVFLHMMRNSVKTYDFSLTMLLDVLKTRFLQETWFFLSVIRDA